MTRTQKFAQSATVILMGLVVFGTGILVATVGWSERSVSKTQRCRGAPRRGIAYALLL